MELKRDGTVKATEILQVDNKQQINKDGTIEFDSFSEVGIVDGLIAYLPLNANARNLISPKSTIVEHNMTYTSESAIFNGISSWIQITRPDFTNLKDLSFSIMIKYDGGGGGIDGRRFIFETFPTYSSGLSLNDAGTLQTLQAWYLSTTNQIVSPVTSSSIFKDVWRHIVVTVQDKEFLNIYIDGEVNRTVSISTLNPMAQITSFNIGTYRGSNNRWFGGEMKQLKIFNRTLTAEEIKTEYNTMFNNEVQIKRSGEITAKEFQENLEEVPVMAGLYYNTIEETWTFKKDERTPEYNPDVELYLMIETRGRQGFTVSRGSFPSGGTVMNPNTEMFIPIDSVLRGDEESLDVTSLVNRALQRKDFKEDTFKEGRRPGIKYNVNANSDNLRYILKDRSRRQMPKGTHKSKGYHYTKMRFIIGYFAEGGIDSGKHKKYAWGATGPSSPDVGQVFKIYYKLNTSKPNTKEIDFLKKQIIVNK